MRRIAQRAIVRGAREAVGDFSGQHQVGVDRGPVQPRQLHLSALVQVRVVRDPDHGPAAPGEVLLQAVQVHPAPGPRADHGEHHHGVPDQVSVAVRLEPVQRGARAPRPVHRRRADQDDLVGQAQHSGHGRVQQAGPAIGEADRVVVLQHLTRVAVVLLAERHRHGRIAIGGEHLQPARGLRGVGPDVRVPPDLVLLVQQVADGSGGLQPDLVGQGAPVGVGVHRDDPVPAQRGQHGAQADGGRGLADAALQAHYRDPVMPAGDRGADPGDQFPAAPLRRGLGRADQAAGHTEDCAAPAADRGFVPPWQEQVGGEAVGRDRLRR